MSFMMTKAVRRLDFAALHAELPRSGHRPSASNLRYIALDLAEMYRDGRGFVNETIPQIANRTLLSTGTVQDAVQALDALGVWVEDVRGGLKKRGRDGKPGKARGTQRVAGDRLVAVLNGDDHSAGEPAESPPDHSAGEPQSLRGEPAVTPRAHPRLPSTPNGVSPEEPVVLSPAADARFKSQRPSRSERENHLAEVDADALEGGDTAESVARELLRAARKPESRSAVAAIVARLADGRTEGEVAGALARPDLTAVTENAIEWAIGRSRQDVTPRRRDHVAELLAIPFDEHGNIIHEDGDTPFFGGTHAVIDATVADDPSTTTGLDITTVELFLGRREVR